MRNMNMDAYDDIWVTSRMYWSSRQGIWTWMCDTRIRSYNVLIKNQKLDWSSRWGMWTWRHMTPESEARMYFDDWSSRWGMWTWKNMTPESQAKMYWSNRDWYDNRYTHKLEFIIDNVLQHKRGTKDRKLNLQTQQVLCIDRSNYINMGTTEI
jgi:hypothetical protein